MTEQEDLPDPTGHFKFTLHHPGEIHVVLHRPVLPGLSKLSLFWPAGKPHFQLERIRGVRSTLHRKTYHYCWVSPHLRHLLHVPQEHHTLHFMGEVHLTLPSQQPELLMHRYILPMLRKENLSAQHIAQRLQKSFPGLTAQEVQKAHSATHDRWNAQVLANRVSGQYTVLPWVRMNHPYPGNMPSSMDYMDLGVRFWKDFSVECTPAVLSRMVEEHEWDPLVRRRIQKLLELNQPLHLVQDQLPKWLYLKRKYSLGSTRAVLVRLCDEEVWVEPLQVQDGPVVIRDHGQSQLPLSLKDGGDYQRNLSLVLSVGLSPNRAITHLEALCTLTPYGEQVLRDIKAVLDLD